MREILFRGKFGNEWKYGFLSIEPQGLVIKEPYKNDSSNVWHIESDTIGQYTGFKDKDGNKIFEGDIVEFTDSDGDTTLYEVFWDGNNGKFLLQQAATEIMLMISSCLTSCLKGTNISSCLKSSAISMTAPNF